MSFRLLSAVRPLTLLSLLLWAQSALAWWSPDWAYRKAITVDAAAIAVPPGESAKPVVVLVRLHEGVLPFADANADGSDIRFVAEDDKTLLPSHIEKFDAVFNLGFAWVALPELKGGTPVKLWMYYGNANASALPEPRETYTPDDLLIYHFSDAPGAPAADASPSAVNATTAVPGDDAGLIGTSAQFDGTSLLQLPDSPTVAHADGALMSWSFWMRAAQPQNAVMVAQGTAFAIALEAGRPVVMVNGAPVLTSSVPVTDDAWHHVGVVLGDSLSLFIDGRLAGNAPLRVPAFGGPISIGGMGAVPTAAAGRFVGQIDELQVQRRALSPAWMQMTASNQGLQDRLVAFGEGEASATGHTSHFAIILSSLTLDAWIAIGVLMVMMVISFFIMYVKARQLVQASKGNREFWVLLEQAEGDPLRLADTLPDPSTELDAKLRAAVESPLYAIHEAGVREVRRRVGLLSSMASLSSAAVDSIRASMETAMVRQSQALSKTMVLLTIAISGGPFIGLLGTVMGVMITFAAVAAAGDVNVNAIAPGIAAALAATVAGLLVAIPSLFGYNYLLTRVKDTSADMQVFVQEFTTRIAERYQ